jgi:sugar O-acyltransferase (sialic acid O-acetyltransferase NeuD family)
MKQLVIFGCGGHAKSVADVVLFNDPHKKLLFVDKNIRQGETILGFPALSDYTVTDEDVFIAIGDNILRHELCKQYYNNLVSVISNRAYLGKELSLGKGVFVAHNAHVGVLSKLNDFSVINTNASIDHECSVGIAATIAPGAVLCGKVTIGNFSWIGANASVKENITITDSVIIGMGSVVINDIITTGVYAGCPVSLVRTGSGNK